MQSVDEMLELAIVEAPDALARIVDGVSKADGVDRVILLAAECLALTRMGDSHEVASKLASTGRIADELADDTARAVVAAVAGVIAHLEGDDDRALLALNTAIPRLAGGKLAWALAHRSEVNYRLGRFDASRSDSDAAIGLADESDQPLWSSRAALTRAALHVRKGDPETARRRLEALRDSLLTHGHNSSAATALTALGKLEHQSGHVDMALNFLDDAEELLADLGHAVGDVWRDRAAMLMASHLHPEADVAAAAIHDRSVQPAQNRLDSLLVRAQAALLAGRNVQAADLAAEAADLGQRVGRRGWAAFAEYVSLRARDADDGLNAKDLGAVDAIAADLAAAGLHVEAARTLMMGSRIAADVGDHSGSRSRLVKAADNRHSKDLERSVLGWLATCLSRLEDGDRRGASVAARAGLRRIERHSAAFGSMTGLHVGDVAATLTDLGLQLAWSSGSPRRLFSWIELSRLGSRLVRTGNQLNDDEIKIGRIMLRQANDELRYAVLGGREVHGQLVRRDLLQRELAALALDRSGTADDIPSARAVLEQLGDATLVEFVEIGDSLVAVSLSGGRVRRFDLGRTAAIRDRVDDVAIELRRLSQPIGSKISRAAALETMGVAVDELESCLLGPLRIDADHLVVVPGGPTFGIPWAILPSLQSATVEVAPSAAMWLERAIEPNQTLDEVTVIAGPGLEHSVDEIARVASIYPHATKLIEPSAARAAEAIDGAALAHVACHGTLRVDNPRFSSLEMGDGPLTVYDMESLESVPQVFVLSACDAGVTTATSSHEVMGLATALLGQGSRAVVANVGLVPDQLATIDLMVELHRGLRSGKRVAAALAAALPPLDYSDADAIAARAFVTFGA